MANTKDKEFLKIVSDALKSYKGNMGEIVIPSCFSIHQDDLLKLIGCCEEDIKCFGNEMMDQYIAEGMGW